jgi:hypothetical protein
MSVAVCNKLNELRQEISGLRQDLIQRNVSQREVEAHLQSVSSVLDQFYVVLKKGEGIQCAVGTQACLSGFKECANDPSMCVYSGSALSPTVRQEACESPHAPGEVLMLSAASAFPGTNASQTMFPVAYAKSADLDSPQAVQRHLERNLGPGESTTPRIV